MSDTKQQILIGMIVNADREGKSVSKIMEKTGLSESVVRHWIEVGRSMPKK